MRLALTLGIVAALVAAQVASAGTAVPKAAYVNGDSLAVGTAPYLDDYLPGWHLRQTYDVSRQAYQGVSMLEDEGSRLERVVVMSLGTNGDPSAVSEFRSEVREALRAAGSSRCIVWPNIVRPPYQGTSYAGLNRVLAREARRHSHLRVVDWAGLAAAHPGWFGSDGVHPGPDGYRARAALIARAMKSCRASLG